MRKNIFYIFLSTLAL